MDSLIEKFGIKKIAIVFGVFAVIMVLVLLLLKHIGGEDILFKCSKSANYYNLLDINVDVSLSKVSDSKKLSFTFVVSNDSEYSEEVNKSLEKSMANSIEEKLNEYFYDYVDDVSFKTSVNGNSFVYGFDILLNSDNSEAVNSYLGYDYFNSSIEDTIMYLEGSGYVCEK